MILCTVFLIILFCEGGFPTPERPKNPISSQFTELEVAYFANDYNSIVRPTTFKVNTQDSVSHNSAEFGHDSAEK
jgi:hypothetical protein